MFGTFVCLRSWDSIPAGISVEILSVRFLSWVDFHMSLWFLNWVSSDSVKVWDFWWFEVLGLVSGLLKFSILIQFPVGS